MILRDRCRASMTWPHFAMAGLLLSSDRWSGKIARRIGTRFSLFNGVSQNCLVFGVAKIENWGTLVDLVFDGF